MKLPRHLRLLLLDRRYRRIERRIRASRLRDEAKQEALRRQERDFELEYEQILAG